MRALLLVLAILAAPAQAGPWPRAEGETYVFAGSEGGAEDGWVSLYAERGLPRDLTVGLDAGGRGAGMALGRPAPGSDGRLRAFLRIPVLSLPERRATRPGWMRPWLAAVELGIGADLEEDGDTPLRYGAGLTVGRPIETRLGDGWTTLDVRATLGGGRRPRLNAGLVAGIKPTGRMTLETGLFAERAGATYLTFAPTVQYRLGRFGAARLGLSFKDDGQTLLRLGWARNF